MDLIPFTNENFYELAWRVRNVVYDQVVSRTQDLGIVLDEISKFELQNRIRLTVAEGSDNATGEIYRFLTGEAQITPLNDASSSYILERYIRGTIERMEFLARHVDKDTQAIIELGCGYGLNLFRLAPILDRPDIKYIGAEYTESGRNLCQKLSALPTAPQVQIEFVDHKKPDFSFIGKYENVLIFTCHSLEQVKNLPEDYFTVLSMSAKNVHAIHFEPFGFQMDCSTSSSQTHEALIKEKGWNLNMYSCLLSAKESGAIRILDTRKEAFETQEENPTSIAEWDNNV